MAEEPFDRRTQRRRTCKILNKVRNASMAASLTGDVSVRFGTVLAISLWLAAMPVALIYGLEMSLPYDASVGVAYFVQTLVLAMCLVSLNAYPSPSWLLIAVIYLLSQTCTLIAATVEYGDYHVMDLIGMVAKGIGVAVLVGASARLSISPKEYDRFLRLILLLTAVEICFNLIKFAGSFAGILQVDSSYNLQFSSFFANRNQFGHFLFVSILAHGLYVLRHRPRFWNAALFTLQTVCLVLTLSRGSIGAVLVSAAIFLLFAFRARPLLASVVTAISLAGACFIFSGQYGEVLGRLLVRADAGSAGREKVWQSGLEIWIDSNVIFGVGSFRGTELLQDQGFVLSEFHSFFIETLVGGGVIELLLVVGILVFAASRLIRSPLDAGTRYAYLAGYGGLVVLMAVESVSFLTIGLVGTTFTLFFMIVPLVLSNGFWTPSHSSPYVENVDRCDG